MAATRNLKARATGWVAGVRDRHHWLDVAARGYGRYQRTEGSVSAVHIAYSAFFSIFPLLFAAVGGFGLVLRNNTELRDRILAEAAANLPGPLNELVTQSIQSAQTSARTALGVGLLLLLYSGTGMVVALERGLSRAFGLERAGTFVKQRTRALGWLLSIGLLLGVSVVAAGVLGGASGAILEALGVTGGPARASSFAVTLLVSFALDVVLFTLTFVLLPNRTLRARQVLPGALICAVWWGLLKYFGAFYIGRTIHNAGEVFGQLAIVVGLLVFIHLAAQLLMLTASVQAELLLGPVEAAAPTVGLVEAARGDPPPTEAGAPRRRRVGRLAAVGAGLAWLTLRRTRRHRRRTRR
ncbi:MAG TPA: YihY/virulence factor BrkB family protein [Actinomycetota bacterium]|nr:YihY/virulence factor BrkB family protein [Actinomycetota bacterium]